MDEEEVDLAMQGVKLKPCKGWVTLCLFLCVWTKFINLVPLLVSLLLFQDLIIFLPFEGFFGPFVFLPLKCCLSWKYLVYLSCITLCSLGIFAYLLVKKKRQKEKKEYIYSSSISLSLSLYLYIDDEEFWLWFLVEFCLQTGDHNYSHEDNCMSNLCL